MHWPSTLALLFIDLFSLKECTVLDVKAWTNMTHGKSKNFGKLLLLIDENTCSTESETNVWTFSFSFLLNNSHVIHVFLFLLELSQIRCLMSHTSRRILLSNHPNHIYRPFLASLVQANVLLFTIAAQKCLEDLVRCFDQKNSTYYLTHALIFNQLTVLMLYIYIYIKVFY